MAGRSPRGDAAEIFVRPEAIRLGRDAADLAQFDNQLSGTRRQPAVQRRRQPRPACTTTPAGERSRSPCRNRANSPTSTRGAPVHIGWSAEQAQLLCRGRGLMQARCARLGFILLLTPLLLWLALLIIIPHVDMLLVSLRERVGVGEYAAQPRQLPRPS